MNPRSEVTKTAGERAADKYAYEPLGDVAIARQEGKRSGYATAIVELVEPLERENAELKAERTKLLDLLQKGVDAAKVVASRRGPFHADIETHRFLIACKDVGITPSQD